MLFEGVVVRWRGLKRQHEVFGYLREGSREGRDCRKGKVFWVCLCMCARTCMCTHRKQGINPFHLNPCASQVLSQALRLIILSKDKKYLEPSPFLSPSGTEDLIVSALKWIPSYRVDRDSHSTFPSCVPSPNIWWPLSPHTNPLEYTLQIVSCEMISKALFLVPQRDPQGQECWTWNVKTS